MKRWFHDLTKKRFMTMPMGKLVPVCLEEVVPGDIFRHSTHMMARLEKMFKPQLTPIEIRLSTWFCPSRILWKEGSSGEKGFQDFITGGEDGADAQVHPYVELGTVTKNTLADYLGVPIGAHGTMKFNVLPFRMYSKIYNLNYRDQDLVTEQTIDYGEGQDTTTNTNLVRCKWPSDRFMRARPWESKGSTITIPLGDQAPVTGIGVQTQSWSTGPVSAYETDGSGASSYAKYKQTSESTQSNDLNLYVEEDTNNTGYPNIMADLSAVSGIDLADLRTALGLQEFQQRMAKGSRYTEYLKTLGVILPDFRAQEPELLATAKNKMQISEVLATDGANTGDMYGHGIGGLKQSTYVRMFQEFGYVMTLASIVPKAMYESALHKMWYRQTKFDYFQRELQYVGKQEILNKAIQINHSSPEDTFGYGPRYDSYRQNYDTVHGDFIDDEDDWHMVRQFTGDVALNQSFIECNPTDRIFASTTYNPVKAAIVNRIKAKRPIDTNPERKMF